MRAPDILHEPSSQSAASSQRMLREVASHTAITFLSTLAIQATTFIILSLAALKLPVEAFARLSLIVATVMLANALFELGLNITATKMYGDTRDESYLRTAFAVRLALVPVSAALGAAVVAVDLPDIGLGIGLGAVLNVWNGVRATDQARQDYRSFTRSSVIFAALRIAGGLGALFAFRNPAAIAIALYALPVVACAFSASLRQAREAFARPRPPLAGALRYAGYVYLNAITFIAVPYVPQFFVASRLDATDVGTYGLVLTFTGPVSLVVYSLRSVLLPKMLGSRSELEDMLWSRRGLAVILGLWAMAVLGGVAISFGLDALYGARFPHIQAAFLIFFAGYSGTATIGFYTLSIHTQGLPGLASLVGLVKFVALMLAAPLCGADLLAIVSTTAVMMLAFEIVLVALLARRRPA